MKKILLFLAGFIILTTIVLWVRYGGGAPYPDMSTIPRLSTDAIEEVLTYPEPIGNVAVNAEGRLFFTVHPESRPRGNKLLEYVDGAALPYPSGQLQSELFDTVLGVAIDRFDRLWGRSDVASVLVLLVMFYISLWGAATHGCYLHQVFFHNIIKNSMISYF